ncbi:MAG: 6-phosphofructokinase [Peptostreptococcaceae bacterium]|nr:6-phosphofructokinase [Peptostreptococcaceae bacterium]
MNKIGVLTSGGDSPGMNAAVRAVVRCGINEGLEVYGIYRGFEGLIDGEIEKMERVSVADILQRGGTILKTARSERFMTEEGQTRAVNMLKTFGIEGLVIIGGDGSFRGGADLTKKGISVMGIPGTIDNDLAYTDCTIGFDTAVNTVLEAITKIRDTSSANERTTVIEVMGRACGDIALYSGLGGGAEFVLIPEVKSDFNDVCKKVVQGVNRGKQHSIIIKAEGYPMKSDNLVKGINEYTGRETKLVVLSYLQRGGSPTLQDRKIATLCGAKAIELLKNDSTSKAIGVAGGKIVEYDLFEALEQKHVIDLEMYNLIDILSR